jgi:hypothetical protein
MTRGHGAADPDFTDPTAEAREVADRVADDRPGTDRRRSDRSDPMEP